MSSPRVLFVCRHYWPHVNDDLACHLMRLTGGLAARGFQVDVATPKFASAWADRFRYRDVTVHRPLTAPRRDWTISRYTRQLTSWLRTTADTYDLMIVESIREEAIAAIEACRGKSCRVALRMRANGTDRDEHWWGRSRASKRCAAIGRMADAVLINDADQQRGLLTYGYSDTIIHRVPIGVPVPINASAVAAPNDSQREAARYSLSSANGDLHSDCQSRTLLCHCPMDNDSGIRLLVEQIAKLVTRMPNVRVWLIGDGPARDKIYSRLRGDGVRDWIAMPGSFSDLEDLILVADAYVQVGTTGLQYVLPAVIAGNLPIIAVDNPQLRNYFASSADHLRWFLPEQPNSMVKQIQKSLDSPVTSKQSASLLKRHFTKHFSESAMLDQYASLVRDLINQVSSTPTICSTTGKTG